LKILNRIADDVRLMFRRPVRVQCAALCYRFKKKSAQPEMLVITSRDTGRWVIPKGWPMEGKTLNQVAAREAYEEAGVKGEPGADAIGFYTYEKGMNNGMKIPCRVQVYPVVVFDMAKRFPEKGSRTIEWVSFEEAAIRVAEPLLKDLILAFENRLLSTMNADALAAAQKTA
jgi:8-oxo-dGTP pyrophosphatase MutT (NUDIX family)